MQRHEHKCHVSEMACVLPWHSSEVREGGRQPLGQQYLHHMTIHRAIYGRIGFSLIDLEWAQDSLTPSQSYDTHKFLRAQCKCPECTVCITEGHLPSNIHICMTSGHNQQQETTSEMRAGHTHREENIFMYVEFAKCSQYVVHVCGR